MVWCLTGAGGKRRVRRCFSPAPPQVERRVYAQSTKGTPMKVTIEETGICEKKIVVSFTAEDVKERYDAALANYRAYAPIAGFRKGKAPAALVAKRFGHQIAKDAQETLEAAGWRKFFQDYPEVQIIAEKGAAKRNPATLTLDQDYEVSLDVVTAPVVTVPDAPVAIEARKVVVTDEEISQMIDGMLKRAAEFADAPEGSAVKAGDLVGIAYSATLDGKPLDEAVPAAAKMAKSDDYWAVADEQYSFVPGVGQALVDMKPGDEKDIDVAFDDKNAPVPELAGKTTQFHVKVNRIRTQTPAALDEKFFKRMQVKDEAELRKSVEHNLFHEKSHAEWSRRQAEAVDKLLEKVGPVACAEYEVEREANRLLYDAVVRQVRAKIPEDKIKEGRDQLAAECHEQARKLLAHRYLLKAVAAKENLSVSDHEASHELMHEAYRHGFDSIKALAKHLNADEETMLNAARDNLLTEKAVTSILLKATWSGEDADHAKAIVAKWDVDDLENNSIFTPDERAQEAAEAADAADAPAAEPPNA